MPRSPGCKVHVTFPIRMGVCGLTNKAAKEEDLGRENQENIPGDLGEAWPER